MQIIKLPPELFTWSRWRRGGEFLADKKISCSQGDLLMSIHRARIRKHAIGYCHADSLVCRPKQDHKAIMLWNGEHLWFHITNSEFDYLMTPPNTQGE